MMETSKEGKSRWRIGKESILPLVIGIGAYIGLEALFALLDYPAHTYYYIVFAIFPAIAVPIALGAKYGPIVGFLTGFGGKILADALLYGGVWIFWPIGIGLMGLIAGLNFHKYYPGKYAKGSNLFRLSLVVLLAAFIGSLIPSLLSIFTDQLGLLFPIIFYSLPLFFIAAFNGVILAPIIVRSIEYVESRHTPPEPTVVPSSAPSNLTQLGTFIAGFCYLVGFGFLFLNIFSASGMPMGCGAGAPFGHELISDLRLAFDLGAYLFLGFGTCLSVILIITWLYSKKKNKQ